MKLNKENLEKYFKRENFFSRDLSWVEFNKRVLEEATNPSSPLLERIKFISIFFTNLDEFYMIRVSGIKQQIRANIIERGIDGLTPAEELNFIQNNVLPQVDVLLKYWNNTIIPQLAENNVNFVQYDKLSDEEKDKLSQYFIKEIYPVLTPLAFDPGRPFPYISNLSLSLAIQVMKPSGQLHFARLKIPSILPRIINLDGILENDSNPSNSGFSVKLIWLDDLIKNNLEPLFPRLDIISAHKFRITRNADLNIQEDEADDLLSLIEENIKRRKFGSVVRLAVEKDMPYFMINILTENLEVSDYETQVVDGPMGLSTVMSLYDLPLPHLKDKPFYPVLINPFDDEERESIFSIIKQKDILLHHPYDSFEPVIELIKEAASDPNVLAIKQTLYRIGPNSPIVKHLIQAAEANKQVAVLVELKARFDEENNIYWARALEKVGVHVVYGLVGLKTHSKMTLIVRKENDGVQRYVHLGTGNYNASSAKLYTDYGLMTKDKDLCEDVAEIFNYLTGYSEQKVYRKMWVAPLNIRKEFLKLIGREIDNSIAGKTGYISFKLNSLVDPVIIAALYEASQNGVKIDLVVRGICCLVPQVPGLSENIFVRSIVGRFLEHSRVYYFYNDGQDEIFMGSADIMERNLDRRVETIFPIEDHDIKKTVKETLLNISLKDNQKARILLPTGKYVPNHKIYMQDDINLQEWLMHYASSSEKKKKKLKKVK
ncbi:MAG: polyphosphate kinase 1 [Bacteroidetes bacterium]|nr:polyphosphate kinase 1 [Bacteroidota bacterium]MBU1114824.1 polyphosphate kinase 1 [Bacteroidota bacterium]MBU1799971.1 polyphosphate kinase 1 [Bacteroidota bacterium]